MDHRKNRNPRTRLIVPVIILAVLLLAVIAFPPFVSVPTGHMIASVTVENVDFTDAFTDAVEAKQVALQTKLKTETQQAELVSIAQSTAERDLIAARTDAEKRTILAEAEASVKRIEADADAYKVKVQSEAEAAANKLIASSLTDSLIRYTQANRWNGSLPQIVGNSTTLPVLDLTGTDASN